MGAGESSEKDAAAKAAADPTAAAAPAAAADPKAEAKPEAKAAAKAAAVAATVVKAEMKMKEALHKKDKEAAPKAASPKAGPKAASAAVDAAASIAAPAKAGPGKPKGKAEPKAKTDGEDKKDGGEKKEGKGEGKGKGKKEGKGQGKGKVDNPGNRICVKNLHKDMTQEQLKTLFDPFGTVGTVHVKTNEEGQCRGFGFVTLGSAEEATKAIAGMDKKEVGGKALTVSLAEYRQQQEGEKGKGKGKDGKGKGQDDSKGKGKGKDKGAAAQGQQQGYQAPYPYNPQQQQMAAQYPGYPYNQMYGQHGGAQQQMQAAQLAQMQAMVQGMYLQGMYNREAYQQQHIPSKAPMPVGPVGATAAAQATPQDIGDVSNQEFEGVLKSLSSRNGYGFIDCKGTRDLYSRDVYVSADLLPETGKEPGAKLKFTLGLNTKGHPQARTCSLA